jgi:hypothetical protein
MQADNRFCRNCPHHRDGHIAGLNWNRMRHSTDYRNCYGEIDDPDDDRLIMPCLCSEYIPKDNLEYLEYCEAKRNSNENQR